MTESHSSTPTVIAGWREWVRLPAMGVGPVKAKLDTGARTSSLHAFELEEFECDGAEWVRFSVHPWQRSDEDAVLVECPVLDRRMVRSSTGHEQERYAVTTEIEILGRTITTELTLSRRDEMGFRMLIGRQALEQGFLVDSSRSYLGGRPSRRTRRLNRGREA
ncbi:RimK/LysX family protein [Nocardioides sp. AE5]|uniref:ATP-dependent zinc protease family protein n=1 Tax=Nocardioides sp. AE5 TaxID=2962573 RepID=UPI0028816305|nr:RimK/LysX family protein [Nocardioides sp. AE5]MDT0203394.1 RimK/LysX family protein [Nocardioides sp. AE5]